VDSERGVHALPPTQIPTVQPLEELAPPPPPAPAIPVINYDIVPSLRGKAVRDPALGPVGKDIAIRGQWAMIDAHHGQEGMSSDFELTLLETFTPANILILQGADQGELKDSALSGKYAGWFRLKRTTGTGTDQVQERDVILSFSMRAQGGFDISGEGANKYGDYVLKGHMNADQTVVMYRQYVIKLGGVPPATSPRNKKGGKAKQQAAPKALKAAGHNVKLQAVLPPASQRDGAGRDRKKTAVMAEAYAVGAMLPQKPAFVAPEPVETAASVAASQAASQRAQRLSQHLLRCEALLKEMVKLPPAFYFLEPVDPIKLGIPDYSNVIQFPMDFGTVRAKLQAGEYASPTDFATDVRLVFRNAITFNQMRDNPVHMAARELSTKFEERFRILHMQLSNPGIVTNPQELAAIHQKASRPIAKPKSKPTRKPSINANLGMYGGGVAAAPDGSMVQFAEMQRMMQSMRQELNGLRQQTNQNNVVAELDAMQYEAQNPLTYVEKKALIAEIHKLPQEHMEKVIEIVTAAKPDTGDDEEIEIPLDELDTSTMRQLQRYVASLKKPKAEARPAAKAAPPAKKAKVEPMAYEPYAVQAPAMHHQVSAPAPAPAPAPAAGGGFGARRALPTEQQQHDFPIFQQDTPTTTTTASSNHMDGALGEIDFSAMSSMMDADEGGLSVEDPETAAMANAAAWGAASPSTGNASSSQQSSGNGLNSHPPTGLGTWGAAGNELLEKQQREEQFREQGQLVEQQRRTAEAASVAAIADAAARQAEQQHEAAAHATVEQQRAAQAVAAQREQDRQTREAIGATIQGDNTDLARHITGVAGHGHAASTGWQ